MVALTTFKILAIFVRWNHRGNVHREFTNVVVNTGKLQYHVIHIFYSSITSYDLLTLRFMWNYQRLTLIITTNNSNNLYTDVEMSSVAERQKVDHSRLDRDQITTVKELGNGNFDQVSKAVYKPLISEVAVKSLKGAYFTFFTTSNFSVTGTEISSLTKG